MSDTKNYEGMSFRELQSECKLLGMKGTGTREELLAKLGCETPDEIPLEVEGDQAVQPPLDEPTSRPNIRVECGSWAVRILPAIPHAIEVMDSKNVVRAQVRMRRRNEIGKWEAIDDAKRLAVLMAYSEDMFDMRDNNDELFAEIEAALEAMNQ